MRTMGQRFLPLMLLLLPVVAAAATPPADKSGVEAFNMALDAATRKMDNAGIAALWDEDGVSLLPSTAPIMGKKAISKFLDDVMGSLHGAHMTSFEMECHDIQVSGDLATEWCTEHQVVDLGNGKAPFDGRGRMLFVLRRSKDGWRIREEMWNQAPAN